MMNFTAAMRVLDNCPDLPSNKHITLCFAECVKGGKVQTTQEVGICIVHSIVYWEHCKLTVALVHSGLCYRRNEYYESAGYKSELGYVPHITLCIGNKVEQYSHLVGKVYSVGEEYIRIYGV